MATTEQILQQILEAIRGNNNPPGGPPSPPRPPRDPADEIKTLKQLEEAYGKIANVLDNINNYTTLNNKLTADGYKTLEAEINELQQKNEITQDYAKTLKDIADNAQRDEKEMDLLKDELRLLKDGREAWKKLGDAVQNFDKKVAESLGVSSSMFKDLAFEADKLGRNFQSSTGFTQDFRDSMLTVSKAAIDSGVSMADASAALNGMASNLSSFDPLAKKSNETLATQVALLGKLGVDANSAATSIDFLERSMNMSRDAAANLTMELATFADGMGVMSGKMMSDFQAVSGTLAMQGKDMVKTFKNIAAQAKATGIEVSQLVTIAQRFNTFSDAADNVAKLNAVLGTQMSTIELMGMRQDERIDHLRDQVQMTVGDFNDLDMYTQQFIANAMGFKDVGEAGRFLNMSAKEQDEFRLRAEESAKTQEQIAEITQDFLPIMERLQLSFMKAALQAQPFIEAMIVVFDKIFALDEVFNNKLLPTISFAIFLYGLFYTGLAMYKAYTAVASAVKLLGMSFTQLNVSLGVVGLALAGIYMIVSDPDHAAWYKILAGTVGVLAIAFTFLSTSAKKWYIVGSLLATLLGMQINPLFVNAFAHMAIGVSLLAVAFQFVSTKAMIAAVVLGLMFGAFAFFFAEMSGAGENLLSLSLGFVALGVALALVGALFSNPAVMLGAAIFTGLMLGLAAAVALMGTGIEKMGSGFEKMVESLKSVKGIMAELDGVVTNSFIAVTQEGGATRAIIANGDGLSGLLAGNVKVDVNIPKISSPDINVKVFLDGTEMRRLVKDVMKEVGG